LGGNKLEEIKVDLHNNDCRIAMKQLIESGVQVDSVVTDPPYEIGFMGKSWDSTGIAFQVEVWELALQLLKPGGYLLAFSSSRTYHRIAVAIEDSGFEIRDQIMWVYGSGFPKGLDIGKAIDIKLGNEREVIGKESRMNEPSGIVNVGQGDRKEVVRILSKGNSEWEGWGTALKPAHEPIVMARKPISEKTIADNVLKYSTGGINIDGCRVGEVTAQGRYPANFIHDGSDEVISNFPVVEGKDNFKRGASSIFGSPADGSGYNGESKSTWANASRFFYCAKASKKEREIGLSSLGANQYSYDGRNEIADNPFARLSAMDMRSKNIHPTVKPIALMKYLCRLVTPKGGTVLDPFMGSGSTGVSAKDEGFNFIGIELDEDYFNLSKHRIEEEQVLETEEPQSEIKQLQLKFDWG
jgi:site-specific DNA-methyltransferase (adenine-specific)